LITLHLNKYRDFKVGEVVHLKITKYIPGVWRLEADDVTPLPGAEPTGYACHMCGIVEAAKPDGSLPDGWVEKEIQEGSFFVCSEVFCQQEPFCRVCGCTDEHACETDDGPCHWVEDDLCSACVGTCTLGV